MCKMSKNRRKYLILKERQQDCCGNTAVVALAPEDNLLENLFEKPTMHLLSFEFIHFYYSFVCIY